MIKHSSLKDFVNLVESSSDELKIAESKFGKLSTVILLDVLVNSNKELARKFSYVFGSMLGSQDLQFESMLDRLTKAGKVSAVRELKLRRNLPCIDLQECIWLLNRDSSRDRTRDYNYSDYFSFASKQFISGKVTNFTIDWALLSAKGDLNGESTPIIVIAGLKLYQVAVENCTTLV